MAITLAMGGLRPVPEGTLAQRMKVRACVAFGAYKTAAYMGLPLTYEKSVAKKVDRRLKWAMEYETKGTGRLWTAALGAASNLERCTAAREGALRSILMAAAANFIGNDIETAITSCFSGDRQPDLADIEGAVAKGMRMRLDGLFSPEASALFEYGEIREVAGRLVASRSLLVNMRYREFYNRHKTFYLKWNGVRMVHNAMAEWSYKHDHRIDRDTFIINVALEMAHMGYPWAVGLLLM
ncbi:MAG: hypothetical protein PHV13_02140 [Candidatus ainarchaeum sp.]|nr:hypothetical protein [Candidatus ainarchaeum sp.]